MDGDLQLEMKVVGIEPTMGNPSDLQSDPLPFRLT